MPLYPAASQKQASPGRLTLRKSLRLCRQLTGSRRKTAPSSCLSCTLECSQQAKTTLRTSISLCGCVLRRCPSSASCTERLTRSWRRGHRSMCRFSLASMWPPSTAPSPLCYPLHRFWADATLSWALPTSWWAPFAWCWLQLSSSSRCFSPGNPGRRSTCSGPQLARLSFSAALIRIYAMLLTIVFPTRSVALADLLLVLACTLTHQLPRSDSMAH